ncbi:helix-turn-helix domain-containing protein [Microbulbifer variabilis]|uniref:helix-turn-helix domain-containing protein n=1 Tax=Microbulbifer variabilis TaxID=266805 RepID=UPI0012F777E0|nr:hypothetical protein [Microbulbifer variabilis]
MADICHLATEVALYPRFCKSAAYEYRLKKHAVLRGRGRRKVSASMLPKLAQLFGISVDELVGMEDKPAKRGPVPKLLRQVEQVTLLPKAKQKFVSEMLETVIQQASH